MGRTILSTLAIAVCMGLLAGIYTLGMMAGQAQNHVTQTDIDAFTACMNLEADLRAHDGGPTIYGPCLQSSILSWQR